MTDLLDSIRRLDHVLAAELIDRAPLAEVNDALDRGTDLKPVWRHRLRKRAAQLTPRFERVELQDKAVVLDQLRSGLRTLLATPPAAAPTLTDRVFWRTLPQIVAFVDKLDAAPRERVEEGALVLVERRVRLHDQHELVPISQMLCLFTSGFPGVLPAPPPEPLPDLVILSPTSPLGRDLAGLRIGDAARSRLPSVRAEHIRMGFHGAIDVPDEEYGDVEHLVVACL